MKHLIFGIILTGLLPLLGACGEEPPPPAPKVAEYSVEVKTTDIDQNPLAKVPVMLDSKVVGFTDKDGVFKGVLKEQEGKEVTLDVGEVEGYRWTMKTTVTEKLRLNSSGDGIPITLNAAAETRLKEYMVWVQAKCDGLEDSNCQNLEVKKDDEVVATTDEFGYAYFITEAVPETDLTVVLDTPTQNTVDAKVIMSPEDPKYTVKLGLDPHVYLIEETFTNAVAPKKTVRKKSSKKRAKKSSKKKSSKKKTAKKKTTKKKDKKKDEVIDLW